MFFLSVLRKPVRLLVSNCIEFSRRNSRINFSFSTFNIYWECTLLVPILYLCLTGYKMKLTHQMCPSVSLMSLSRDAYTDPVMDGSEISERSSSTGCCFYGSDGVSFLYRSLVGFAYIHFWTYIPFIWMQVCWSLLTKRLVAFLPY